MFWQLLGISNAFNIYGKILDVSIRWLISDIKLKTDPLPLQQQQQQQQKEERKRRKKPYYKVYTSAA